MHALKHHPKDKKKESEGREAEETEVDIERGDGTSATARARDRAQARREARRSHIARMSMDPNQNVGRPAFSAGQAQRSLHFN